MQKLNKTKAYLLLFLRPNKEINFHETFKIAENLVNSSSWESLAYLKKHEINFLAQGDLEIEMTQLTIKGQK